MIRVDITEDPIDPGGVLDAFASEGDGAVLLFLGVIRDHNQGRTVRAVAYEAYSDMARETLETIAGEAGERIGTDRITVLHRVGMLEVGEIATAIAVASPHRAEAYEGSRYIIEEIKKRLPIWKKEAYVGGEEAWVEGQVPPPSHVPPPSQGGGS